MKRMLTIWVAAAACVGLYWVSSHSERSIVPKVENQGSPGTAGAAPARTDPDPANVDPAAQPPSAAAIRALVAAPGTALADRAIWDAARRLRDTPELADELAEIAVAAGTSPQGRELALDLLAHADVPEAQDALVMALDDVRLRQVASDREAGMLYQRIGFVKAPTAETQSRVVAWVGSDEPVKRRAAMAAAGGLARRLAAAGSRDAADGLLAGLRGTRFAHEKDQAAVLIGLGNGAQAQDLAALLTAARDSRVNIRHAAARGLRHYPGADVVVLLAQLGVDVDPGVQRAALRGLTRDEALSTTALRTLRARVDSGQLNRANHPLLVNALVAHPADAETRLTLESVLRKAENDAGLRARIRQILNAG